MSSASRTGRCGSSSKTKRVILTLLRADKSSPGVLGGGGGIISPKLRTAKVPPASGVTPVNKRESVKKKATGDASCCRLLAGFKQGGGTFVGAG